MKKRFILGIIAILSAIAVQNGPLDAAPTENLKSYSPSLSPVDTPAIITVTRVVDGDTIIIDNNGVPEKVRLIGVDTPETVDPRKPVQCFGKEASAFTRTLLLGVPVKLEEDNSQGNRDKYGRLLRYVFLKDGTFVNKKIIAGGYGHEYTYRIPYQYQTEFKAAEKSARESRKGLWAPDACNK